MEKKEAMKILKDFHDKSALFSVRTALDTIIPELKESEDERIRKMIIYQMERWHKAALENNAVQDIKDSADAITWLEKQGEKKPNYCHHEVDLSDCSEEYRKAYYDGWNNCNQQHEQLKAEQKPALSEEDIKALNRISAILVDASEVKNWWKEYRLIEREEIIRLTDFLKSLIDRIYPQPTEWNEEDETMYQGIIETEQYMLDVVYGRKIFAVGNEAIKEECTKELAWLKSLKDRIK